MNKLNGAAFARKVELTGTLLCIQLGSGQHFQEPLSLSFFCKKKDCEVLLPINAQNMNKGMISIDISSILEELGSEKKWEVYLKNDTDTLRIESTKNKGRRRYHKGLKVKPYDKVEKIYNESQRVKDYVVIPGTDNALYPRFTRDWQLMFQRAEESNCYKNRFFILMQSLALENDEIVVTIGKETYGFEIKSLSMNLRGTSQEYTFSKDTNKKFHLPVSEVNWNPFFWDFAVLAERDGKEYHLQLRNFKKGFCGNVSKKMGDYCLFSFLTQNDNIILHYRPYSEYDDEKYRKREKKAVFLYRLFKPFWDARGIVLLYEKFCKCAQDNSFYMFEYYMTEGSRKDKRRTYYIIDSREPDAKKLAPYKQHVVEFMSLKHMIYIQAAKLLVSIDTIKHAYQWRGPNTPILDRLLTKHSVFLQHGVLALKRVEYIYNKNGGNKTDLFISSSEMEQKIITKNFRYSKAEVPVTGLARWDVLKDKSHGNHILFMPTWRNWIVEVEPEEFVMTDYFKAYMGLLNSRRLAGLLEKYDAYVTFCMHPKFREFIHEFGTLGDRVQLFDYSTRPINELVMEASMMVTDYSSVSWDMYYMEKPIVFYQFDYERYESEQGSYIDMTKELYGDRAETENELLNLLEGYLEHGFEEKEVYKELRKTYLPCRDGKHRKRIDKAIKNHNFTILERIINQKILRR